MPGLDLNECCHSILCSPARIRTEIIRAGSPSTCRRTRRFLSVVALVLRGDRGEYASSMKQHAAPRLLGDLFGSSGACADVLADWRRGSRRRDYLLAHEPQPVQEFPHGPRPPWSCRFPPPPLRFAGESQLHARRGCAKSRFHAQLVRSNHRAAMSRCGFDRLQSDQIALAIVR